MPSTPATGLPQPGAVPMTVDQAIAHAGAAYRAGRLTEAESVCRQVLAAQPDAPGALHLLGIVAARTARPKLAVELLGRAAAAPTAGADVWNNLGNAQRAAGQPMAALASFERAIGLQPALAAAHNNRATVLLDLGRSQDALAGFEQAIALRPDYAEAFANRAKALLDLGRRDEALASCEHASALRPDYPDAYLHRGNALRSLGRRDDALASYDRAIALRPGYAGAYVNRGVVLGELGRAEEAMTSLQRGLELDPEAADAWENLGHALRDRKRFEDALRHYDRALALRPGHADLLINRANALLDLKRHQEALDGYDAALAINPRSAIAYHNRGIALRALQRLAEAYDSFGQALAIDPGFPLLFGNWLSIRMQFCEWDGIEDDFASLIARVERGEPVTRPFALLAVPSSPEVEKQAAEIFVRERCPPGHALPPLAARPAGERIRVGYFSADYREHATAWLMAELFEQHDRSRFEFVAFSFSEDSDDPVRTRLEASFDAFLDVRALSDAEVARLARERGIDIAVDLKGFTQDHRAGIFAERAAPVQASYIGYPGTMGAPYIDYLIADAVIVPPGAEPHYTEKIVRVPGSYQPNDTRRPHPDAAPSREALGLPATGVVLCCFNNSYKITPTVFDVWMRLLHAVPGSVFWLLHDNERTTRNLRREAARRGVDERRLVFAPRAPATEHLARHLHADLFLDTLPYNAHTTTSDALWMGVPVLTCLGDTFAGRVAASLLLAMDLPDLVTRSLAEYESLACALALDAGRLRSLKDRVAAHRTTSSLFRPAALARHLEAAYAAMIARHRAGLPPDHITVAG